MLTSSPEAGWSPQDFARAVALADYYRGLKVQHEPEYNAQIATGHIISEQEESIPPQPAPEVVTEALMEELPVEPVVEEISTPVVPISTVTERELEPELAPKERLTRESVADHLDLVFANEEFKRKDPQDPHKEIVEVGVDFAFVLGRVRDSMGEAASRNPLVAKAVIALRRAVGIVENALVSNDQLIGIGLSPEQRTYVERFLAVRHHVDNRGRVSYRPDPKPWSVKMIRDAAAQGRHTTPNQAELSLLEALMTIAEVKEKSLKEATEPKAS